MCLPETCLLQPLLRGSQVLCSGSGDLRLPGSGLALLPRSVCRCSRLLRSGSGLCAGLRCSGRVALLPGSGCRSGLLCAGCLCSALLPGPVCRSSVL